MRRARGSPSAAPGRHPGGGRVRRRHLRRARRRRGGSSSAATTRRAAAQDPGGHGLRAAPPPAPAADQSPTPWPVRSTSARRCAGPTSIAGTSTRSLPPRGGGPDRPRRAARGRRAGDRAAGARCPEEPDGRAPGVTTGDPTGATAARGDDAAGHTANRRRHDEHHPDERRRRGRGVRALDRPAEGSRSSSCRSPDFDRAKAFYQRLGWRFRHRVQARWGNTGRSSSHRRARRPRSSRRDNVEDGAGVARGL